MTDDQYPWIRTDRAAAYLDITPNNLRVLGHRRRWPTCPLGGGWVGYHIRDLDREKEARDTHRDRASQRRTPSM